MSDPRKKSERIAELEAQVAVLSARLAALEAKSGTYTYPYTWPNTSPRITFTHPYTINCADMEAAS